MPIPDVLYPDFFVRYRGEEKEDWSTYCHKQVEGYREQYRKKLEDLACLLFSWFEGYTWEEHALEPRCIPYILSFVPTPERYEQMCWEIIRWHDNWSMAMNGLLDWEYKYETTLVNGTTICCGYQVTLYSALRWFNPTMVTETQARVQEDLRARLASATPL